MKSPSGGFNNPNLQTLFAIPEASSSETAAAAAKSASGSSKITSKKSSKKSNVGAIAGGVIGGVVVLAAIIGAIIFFLRRRKTTHGPKYNGVDQPTNEYRTELHHESAYFETEAKQTAPQLDGSQVYELNGATEHPQYYK